MRNLTPTGLRVVHLDESCRSSTSAALAADPDDNGLFVAVERKLDEGGLEIDIIRLSGEESDRSSTEVKLDDHQWLSC